MWTNEKLSRYDCSKLNDYLRRWTDDDTLDRIHHALCEECRELARRDASPTAAIIDSQSAESAKKRESASTRRATMPARGSRERSAFCLEGTLGVVLHAIIHAANIQDRDGGLRLTNTLFGLDPFLHKIYADGGFRGRNSKKGCDGLPLNRRRDHQAIRLRKGVWHSSAGPVSGS